MIDIFSAAGLKAPDISILSDEFVTEVKGPPAYKNLAFEAVKKLLNDEIKARSKKNMQPRLFYDALEVNGGAVKVLDDETFRKIARALVETVHRNATIDWTVKESVRASLRTMAKRILREYGYPPDKLEKATQTVLERAELIAKDWAA